MTLLHKDIEPRAVHAPYSWVFKDTYERLNVTKVTNADIGKLCRQTDNDTIWKLDSTNPSWTKVLQEGDATTPTGLAGGDLEGSYPNPSIINDSHSHTPGVTIPSYPTRLPPTGLAGGDLQGNYPNPLLSSTGVSPGTYTNPTITVDDRGRLTNIQPGVTGETNRGNNIGNGVSIYEGKTNTALNFRSLIAESNSGILINETPQEIKIDSIDLARLSGATFTGDISTPNIETDNIEVNNIIKTPIYDTGVGASWSPNVSNGMYQKRIISGNTFISAISNVEPGLIIKLVLIFNGNHSISLASEYKFPDGNYSFTSQTNSIDLLECFILNNDTYLCQVTNNFR